MIMTMPSSTIPRSSNSAVEEKQLDDVQKNRLDKLVIRFSSWRILFQSLLMIPSVVVLVYFGTHYIDDCPIQPLINIFLIVTGWLNLINIILFLTAFTTANYIKRSSHSASFSQYLLVGSVIGQLVLLLFSVGWLVAGQIWVFGVQVKGFQSRNPTQSATYCHSTVFWNGFATIFITYAIWLILILFFARRFILKRCSTKVSTYEEL